MIRCIGSPRQMDGGARLANWRFTYALTSVDRPDRR